jgi:hypothetical protein
VGELLGWDDAPGVDALQALLDLVQHVEAIDDLIEGCIVWQPFDGADGLRVCMVQSS